jgi:uncharacterized membrane protein
MVIELSNISVLGVSLAALAAFVLGGLWFTWLFSRQYALALGKPHSPDEKPAAVYLVGPIICATVTAATSALLIDALRIESMVTAVKFGALVGAGYLAATTINTAINPNIPRPLLYGLISGAYFFVSSIAVSAILVAIQ